MLSFYLALIDDETSRDLFEQIYLLHRQTMVYAANMILQDQMLAEDATHDAFLRILHHLDKILDPKCHRTRSFVVLIVRNIALDYYRKMKRLSEASYEEYEFAFADDAIDPAEAYQQNEMFEKIQQKISQLRPAYAEVLTLKYSFEYSDQEIAQLLGITGETVRTRLRRARKQLRLSFDEEDM